ncbi:hypothetical protein [Sphingobium estronivorans]|uniref:hypothetical protein n=1 Tax=Sphingobium estronivorans TaxID=1577690 RepID=UPI00123BE77C|nr:hypothetical protein [Sphingobium estronivorans]
MTKAYPVSSGGRNIACGLEFEAGVSDRVYRQGELSAIAGSLYFYGYKGDQVQPFIGLKLVVRDRDAAGTSLTPNAPAQISIFGKDGKSLASGYYGGGDGETPGSKLASFAFDQNFQSVMASISEDDRLEVAFNRKQGGTDVRIPIDLSVSEDGQPGHKGETAVRFLQCLRDLTRELQAKLK